MKKKNLTRIPIYALIIALLLAIFSPVSVFAEKSDTAKDAIYNESSVDLDVEIVTPGEKNEETSEEKTKEPAEDKESFFASLFSAVEDNLSEILSALAFVGSLIIMFSYKKGFIPLIREGLSALSGGVKAVSEKANSLNLNTEQIAGKLEQKLEDAQNLLFGMENTLAQLEISLGDLEKSKKEREMLSVVLCAEVDMLYEIFMSASLPQYLKDNVGEKIRAMKSKLSGDKENEEA